MLMISGCLVLSSQDFLGFLWSFYITFSHSGIIFMSRSVAGQAVDTDVGMGLFKSSFRIMDQRL